ncbi:MAG: hypothetical protein ACRDVP_05345, partial [Acidimicrobiales bacterium]
MTQSYLVRGDDPSLVAQRARALISQLAEGRDPSLIVEEHGGAAEDLDAARVVDACLTPPFLADRRVVVAREAGRISAADANGLIEAITHPLAGCYL